MAGSNQRSFWNQDAVTATALGFAGMAMLQSKLFPAIASINLPWVQKLSASGLFQWWPLLLIVAGGAWWLSHAYLGRSRRSAESEARFGETR
jgi:hypothetical protein